VTRLNRALEELRIEKARECSSLQRVIDESKTILDEKSNENVSQSVTFIEIISHNDTVCSLNYHKR
jgi:hypothetical protein